MARFGFPADSNDYNDDEEEISNQFRSLYDVMEVIGEGGFATVRKCRDVQTRMVYAVKIIITEKITESEQRDIRHEIEICRKLDHPNIVKLICSIEDSVHHYIVFELITGGELFEDIVRRFSYTERDAAHYILQILEAITYVHSMDVCHRDLKPENLLLARRSLDSELKIADFGLAIEVNGDEMKWRGFAGTSYYLSPELLKHQPYGKPIDMWAIGVIMYIMLIGYAPFWEGDEQKLYTQIRSGKFTVDGEWEALTPEARDLIQQMLTVNPLQRITAASALQHDWVQRRHELATNFHREDTIGHLRKFNAHRKLKGAILTTIGATKMIYINRMYEAAAPSNATHAHEENKESVQVEEETVPCYQQLVDKVTAACVIS